MSKEKLFATEADLVAAFCGLVTQHDHRGEWVAYHETAGWDVLLVGKGGIQVGIEAKLSLNAKVLEQALPGRWVDEDGPDYRAVLVPGDDLQLHLTRMARHLGVVIIKCWPETSRYGARFDPRLPDESWDWSMRDWPNWCPVSRCKLPDYIPDVTGGHASPVALTDWKIKAIKLLILLDRRGLVTRADMSALKISPSRWTDHYHGFLTPGPHGGYVRCNRTPDLKAQHPKNWAEIEADIETWGQGLNLGGLSSGGAAA